MMAITITLLTATPTVVPWSLISVTLFSIVLSWLWAKRNKWQNEDKKHATEAARWETKKVMNNKPTTIQYLENEMNLSLSKSNAASTKWHRSQWFICIAIFAYHPIVSLFGIQGNWQDVFLGMFVFWTAFDGFLNKEIDEDMLYLGSGSADKFLKKLSLKKGWILFIKIALIAVSVYAYNW